MTRRMLQRMRKRSFKDKATKKRSLRSAGDQVVQSSSVTIDPVNEGTIKASECVPDPDWLIDSDAVDVGILLSFSSSRRDKPSSSRCQVGYVCIPCEESATGGRCVPSLDDVNIRRNLQNDNECPAGCPPEMCDCLFDEFDSSQCNQALIDACSDGSYVSSCNADPLSQLYADVTCTASLCLDSKGLFDLTTYCDIDNADCEECYCEYYTASCDTLSTYCYHGGIVAESYYACSSLDQICGRADCCTIYSSLSCTVDGYGYGTTWEPTAAPTVDSPYQSPPTDFYGNNSQMSTATIVGCVVAGTVLILSCAHWKKKTRNEDNGRRNGAVTSTSGGTRQHQQQQRPQGAASATNIRPTPPEASLSAEMRDPATRQEVIKCSVYSFTLDDEADKQNLALIIASMSSRGDTADTPDPLTEGTGDVPDNDVQPQLPNCSTDCSICLASWEIGDTLCWNRSADCNHLFHEGCIQKWLSSTKRDEVTLHDSCPICRKKIIANGA